MNKSSCVKVMYPASMVCHDRMRTKDGYKSEVSLFQDSYKKKIINTPLQNMLLFMWDKVGPLTMPQNPGLETPAPEAGHGLVASEGSHNT